jgi:hypothetical protein
MLTFMEKETAQGSPTFPIKQLQLGAEKAKDVWCSSMQ